MQILVEASHNGRYNLSAEGNPGWRNEWIRRRKNASWPRRLRIVALTACLTGLPAAVVVALLKAPWVLSASTRLGLSKSPAREYFHTATMTHQLRVDKNVPPGAILFCGDSRTQDLCASAVSGEAVNFGIGTEALAELADRLPRYRSPGGAGAVVLASGVVDSPIPSLDHAWVTRGRNESCLAT